MDLRKVTAPETPLDYQFAPADVTGEKDAEKEEYRIVEDVRLQGRLSKKDDRYQLKADVRTVLELACGRCLEPFRLPLDLQVELTYQPQPSGSEDPDVELAEEDLSTSYYRDHVLDLGEMLREQFYLALPMRPLCRDDCKGLCPHCGTNLNTGTCACDARWQDPRLAGLQAFLNKKTDG